MRGQLTESFAVQGPTRTPDRRTSLSNTVCVCDAPNGLRPFTEMHLVRRAVRLVAAHGRAAYTGICAIQFWRGVASLPPQQPAPHAAHFTNAHVAPQARTTMTLAGLELAIFGSEDQRLIH